MNANAITMGLGVSATSLLLLGFGIDQIVTPTATYTMLHQVASDPDVFIVRRVF